MNYKIKPGLRISDQGVVFDPSTGESFTVNETGLAILKSLRGNRTDAGTDRGDSPERGDRRVNPKF
ncbi:MAG: hypothetical protein WCY83_06175 [Bacteroidales bacterium]